MLARAPLIAIGIPAVYALLVAAGDLARFVFLLVISLIGQAELIKMLNPQTGKKPLLEWFGAFIILGGAHFYDLPGLTLGFAFAAIYTMIFLVLKGLDGKATARFSSALFSYLYLPFSLGFYLLIAKSMGGQTLFIILASIWALDIGAYLFGMSLRGPKLAPVISPNKTISGAIGGTISTIAFLYFARSSEFLQLSDLRFWALAFATAILGQLSDLFESILKRESQTKDSGAIFGAHGGALDRIDSVLFLGPVCYSLFIL